MSSCLMTAEEAALEHPRINEAIGCLDCLFISRRPEPLSQRCPICRSASIYDITSSGTDRRITAQHLTMIAKLDHAFEAESVSLVTPSLLRHLRYFGRT